MVPTVIVMIPIIISKAIKIITIHSNCSPCDEFKCSLSISNKSLITLTRWFKRSTRCEISKYPLIALYSGCVRIKYLKSRLGPENLGGVEDVAD
jgi:hypothetical protein